MSKWSQCLVILSNKVTLNVRQSYSQGVGTIDSYIYITYSNSSCSTMEPSVGTRRRTNVQPAVVVILLILHGTSACKSPRG